MAVPDRRLSETDARLEALRMPEGGWAAPARLEALARVQAMGLPQRRDEYWKFTRPDTLAQVEPQLALELPVFLGLSRVALVAVFHQDWPDFFLKKVQPVLHGRQCSRRGQQASRKRKTKGSGDGMQNGKKCLAVLPGYFSTNQMFRNCSGLSWP